MLSRQSLEILLDLVEIKLSSMIVQDKEDIKELRKLKCCKSELIAVRREFFKNGAVHEVESLSSQVL
ncbi:MAG: hypothetical protein IJT36_02555 [Alphaproteobacteria bacterium]|nr:hypothetical protein [Alphaproteobacteria bacterium]